MSITRWIIILAAASLLASCSTKKNTWASRAYHNVNSEFNVKFNGAESFKQGMKKAETHQVDDYSELLPVFIFADEGIPGQVTGEMERVIDKGNKLVVKHSITAKPKKKRGAMTQKDREFYNKREYNAVVDDAYLLSAKASLYLQNYDIAIIILDYLLLEYPKESAVNEAKIWLAVALTCTNELDRVPALLDDAGKVKKLRRRERALLHAAYANYYIKQRDYQKATESLDKALKEERRKANKIRYHFILTSLYRQLDVPANAILHLKKIIKSSNDYEQVFSARLLLAGIHSPDAKHDMRKELLRMLEDEKNADFADRIYFALAQAEQAMGNDSAAIAYLQKSIQAESSNMRQKGYAHEALGNYYYKHKQYANAYDHLVLAAEALGATFSRYNEINEKALSLEKLAKNWKTVHREDSLQRIARLPVAEREKLITDAIEKIIEEERKAAEAQQQQQFFINQQEVARYSNTASNAKTGKWYFYNTNSINSGQAAFNMRWGKRRLEDNWRRKDRGEISLTATNEEEAEQDTSRKAEVSNKSREYYTKDLPLTPEAIQASNDKIRPALFGLGEAYMSDVDEKLLSIETFESLNSRFPEHEFTATVYYYLYKLYTATNNHAQSEHYKQLLVANYPKEPLTQMIINPRYLEEQQAIHDNIERMYEDAFLQYKEGRYAEAVRTATQINEQYPQNLIQPQIALLCAFSVAQTESRGVYKQALANLVKQYPNSEEAKTATALLTALDEKALQYTAPAVAAATQTAPSAQTTADSSAAAKTNYTVNHEGAHYFAILFESKPGNDLLFALETYNAEQFLDQNYEVSIRNLAKGYAAALVKTFANRQDAAAYAQKLADEKVLTLFDPVTFRWLLITPENLELLANTGQVIDYLEFFNTEYANDIPANH
jgi:outer membrane protein assembly factor BamD (BamD/ComL family)